MGGHRDVEAGRPKPADAPRRGGAGSPDREFAATPSGRSPSGGAPGRRGPRSPAAAWRSSSRPRPGTPISLKTTSTIPSMRSSLLATWRYSAIGATSSSSASLRMVRASSPPCIRVRDRGSEHPLPAQALRAARRSAAACRVSPSRSRCLRSIGALDMRTLYADTCTRYTTQRVHRTSIAEARATR